MTITSRVFELATKKRAKTPRAESPLLLTGKKSSSCSPSLPNSDHACSQERIAGLWVLIALEELYMA